MFRHVSAAMVLMGDVIDVNGLQDTYDGNCMEGDSMEVLKPQVDLNRARSGENGQRANESQAARRRVASPAPRVAPSVLQPLPVKPLQEPKSQATAPAPVPAPAARRRVASPAPRLAGKDDATAAVAVEGEQLATPSLARRAVRAIGLWGLVLPLAAAVVLLVDPVGPIYYEGGSACGCKQPPANRPAKPCVQGEKSDTFWCSRNKMGDWRECEYSCR